MIMPLMDAEASAKPRRLRRPAGLRHANTTVLSPGDIGDQLASDASTERGTRHQAGDSPSRWPCESSRGVSPSTPLMGSTPDQRARSCGGHRESHWSWRRSWITTGWRGASSRLRCGTRAAANARCHRTLAPGRHWGVLATIDDASCMHHSRHAHGSCARAASRFL